MELLAQYSLNWILGLVVALAATGVVAGLLAGLLGVGGGIVIVPMLYHLFTILGIDESVKMHIAVGTSLATIILTSFLSARAHSAKGNLDKALLKSLIPSLLVGVALGTIVSDFVPGIMLSFIFGMVGLLVAANMAFRSHSTTLASSFPGMAGRQFIGIGVGAFSTLMGIGGGTLSVPIFNAFNISMHRAVGTAAAIGVIISVPGTMGFIVNGVDVPNRPPLTIGYVNLIGFALIVPMTMWMAPIGASIAHCINARLLRQVFALFLSLTALRMLYNTFI